MWQIHAGHVDPADRVIAGICHITACPIGSNARRLRQRRFIQRAINDIFVPASGIRDSAAGLRVDLVQFGEGPDFHRSRRFRRRGCPDWGVRGQLGPRARKSPHLTERAHGANLSSGAHAPGGEVVKLTGLQLLDDCVHFVVQRIERGKRGRFGGQRVEHPARRGLGRTAFPMAFASPQPKAARVMGSNPPTR